MSTLAITWTTPELGYIDPQIAAGHQFVIVSTNGRISFYDKSGALLKATRLKPLENPISVSAFFDELKPSLAANLNLPSSVDPVTFGFNSHYDNRVIFDPYRNRFWIGALTINRNTKNEKLGLTPAQRGSRRTKFLVAVSKTEDPRDGWHRYWWDATKDDGKCNYGENCAGTQFSPGDAGDYPYIGINRFRLSQTNIVGHRDPTTGEITSRRYHMVTMVSAEALANGGLPHRLVPDGIHGSVVAPGT